MTARYALFYAPRPDSLLWRFGSSWLGRCAATGVALPQPRVPGIDAATLRALTAAPRRYGFHGTLKSPFRLARGARRDDLVAALERFCAKQVSICVPRLELAELDGFLALVPATREPRLDALAAGCVRGLDRFRAPPTTAEVARRRRTAALSSREEFLLRRWGYPYVLERFRFHLTLTGPLRGVAAEQRNALWRVLRERFAAGAREALLADEICVFEEPSPGADLCIVHRSRFRHGGRLIYVIGPSGAGKDSLLAWVRERLPPGAPVRFASRTITRPAGAEGEAHLAASRTQFEATRAAGGFALHWRAHGLNYGIGREIDDWLCEGACVIVNGSREHLAAARAKYPQLESVYVAAAEPELHRRIAARGRERPAQATDRLLRNRRLASAARTATLVLANDGPIEVAGQRLAEFIAGSAGASA